MDRCLFAVLVGVVTLGACSVPTVEHADGPDSLVGAAAPVVVPAIPELASLNTELAPDAPRSIREARERFEDRRRDLTRRREDQQEKSRELSLRREEETLRRDIAAAEAARAITSAELGLRHAQEDLVHFQSEGKQKRREEVSLELREAADALADTREELAQLELMYGNELGDATAEIVLERTRRRLELAELRHGLAQEGFVELDAREFPRKEEELESAVVNAQVALENARREAEASTLEHNAKLRAVLVEERALGRATEDLQVELSRLETDIAEWEIERGTP